MFHYSSRELDLPKAERGMTLIELAVVMLILVGLAGVLLPYVTGYSGKTHDSSAATNITEINNAIPRFESEKGRYPSNMDSLIVGAGTATGTVINYTVADNIGYDAATTYGMTPLALSTTANSEGNIVCRALGKAGISTVIDMDDGSKSNFAPTFNNSAASGAVVYLGTPVMTNPPPSSCVGTVAKVATTNVAAALGLDATMTANKEYVAFGIGTMNEMQGAVMSGEAPLHYSKQPEHNAGKTYSRFVALFEVIPNVTTTTSANVPAAKFVGAAMLMGASSSGANGLMGLSNPLSSWYASAAN